MANSLEPSMVPPLLEWVLGSIRELLVPPRAGLSLLCLYGYLAILAIVVLHNLHRLELLIASFIWKLAQQLLGPRELVQKTALGSQFSSSSL